MIRNAVSFSFFNKPCCWKDYWNNQVKYNQSMFIVIKCFTTYKILTKADRLLQLEMAYMSDFSCKLISLSCFSELENLFNAINSPDDGGEEKLEETRSLKPVRKSGTCL